MSNELLMNAIAEISDRHVLEFMDVKPRKKHKVVWISAISAAACIAMIIIAFPYINTGFVSGIGNSSIINQAGMPCVRVNGEVYIYDSNALYELPDGYSVVGEVISSDPSDYLLDGYSDGCKPGDVIYQDPDYPNEIYVYTRLFNGENYRYTKFTKSK